MCGGWIFATCESSNGKLFDGAQLSCGVSRRSTDSSLARGSLRASDLTNCMAQGRFLQRTSGKVARLPRLFIFVLVTVVGVINSVVDAHPARAPESPARRVLVIYSDERLVPTNVIEDSAPS